jgi:HemY protein
MVKIFIYTLLVVVSAVGLTLYLDVPGDPGYLLIAWRNYTLETSVFALVVFVIAFAVAARIVVLLLAALNPMPLFRPGGLFRRGDDGPHSRTNEGLTQFVCGNWAGAQKLLEATFSDEDCALINFLAAGYAAYEIGRHEQWQDYLGQAATKYPSALATINAVRAELLMKAGHLEQSLAVLEQFGKSPARDRQLLALTKEVCLRLEDWQRLKELLPSLKKAGVVDDEELAQLEQLLFRQELQRLAAGLTPSEASGKSDVGVLLECWDKAPSGYRDDPELANFTVSLLVEAGAVHEAARLIESTLSRIWDGRLVARYGELPTADHARQLVQGEDWLQQRPNDAALLLALGRISLRNSEWEKAREYMQTSIAIEPSAEACGELALLLRALGETEQSLDYWSRSVSLAGTRLTDLPLPDQDPETAEQPEESEQPEEPEG